MSLKMFSSPTLSGNFIQIDWQDGQQSDLKIVEPTASDKKSATE
jgi:hypothetical protein